MSLEPKKTLILRILQVLYDFSDAEHPMTHNDIMAVLERDYGIECERKAVGRNISYLKEAGFEIVSDKNGSYLDTRIFERSELRIMIDSVLCSRHIGENYSRDIIDKLVKLGGKNFKSHVKHVYSTGEWNKTDNKDVLLNVELIDEAVEKGKQMTFCYAKLGADGKTHVGERTCVSPYQMVLHNQHYYMMAKSEVREGMEFYRVDKMCSAEILDTPSSPLRGVEGYENGINYRQLSTALPYMFSDKPEKVTLKCANYMADHLYDWFGKEFTMRQLDNEHFVATVTVSLQGMLYWVMQYSQGVEVLSPESLRSNVVKTIENVAKTYGIIK